MTATVQSDLADSRDRYARETRQRMDRAITDLSAVQHAELSRIDRVLGGLRLQEEASRLAGFRGIARLCRDLEDYLAHARGDEQPKLAAVAATLSDVCRTVQVHADAVGRILPRPKNSNDDDLHRTNAQDAGHSMPLTPVPA